MKRICMYTPSASGGHARYTSELLAALARAGRGRYEFELITSEGLDPQYESTAYRVHPILPALQDRSAFPSRAAWVSSRITHYARRELRLLNWLKLRPDVDAVHSQEWTPWLAAPVFRRLHRMGKKVFHTVHNVVPHRYPAYVPKAVMNGWIRRACRTTDGLFVHTELLADELTRFLGGDRGGAQLPPIIVSPHGVWNIADAGDLPPLNVRLRERKLLFFGRIRRNKGLDLLLRAAQRLPGYSITIAGDPADREYFGTEIIPLIERARAAGARIDLLDRFIADEEVGPLFRSHSALVLPYTPDFVAQSGVVFLALAYELPVIASEVGGLRDLFSEHRIGTTFTQFSPEAMASAVEALHADGIELTNLLRDMRAAKERFSWDAAARATLGAYAAALNEAKTEANDCRVQTTPAF